MSSALSALVSPMSAEAFVDAYWGRRHVSWCNLASPFAELAERVHPDSLESLVWASGPTVTVWCPSHDGHHDSIATTPEQAMTLYRAGMTLYLPLVEPSALAVGQAIARELGASERLFRISVFASRRAAGTRAHFDDGDGITLQLHGRKRWQLAANHDAVLPARNYVTGTDLAEELRWASPTVARAAMPDGADEVMMEPGRLLYIPRGTWHATETVEDSLSVDINFVSRSALWADLVAAVARKLAFEHAPARASSRARSPEAIAELDAVLDALRARLAGLRAEDLLYRDEPPRPFDPAAALCWNPAAYAYCPERSDGAAGWRFGIAGNPLGKTESEIELTPELATAARWARAVGPFHARDMRAAHPGLPADDIDALIEALHGLNIVRPC